MHSALNNSPPASVYKFLGDPSVIQGCHTNLNWFSEDTSVERHPVSPQELQFTLENVNVTNH